MGYFDLQILISTEGAGKLSFESSLKLKDVERENKGVTEGKYEPPDCTARQSVAILIPQRNREKHLLYLLHHLHPFLQRQQLHYAIYVIQQVLRYIKYCFVFLHIELHQGTALKLIQLYSYYYVCSDSDSLVYN